MLRATSSVLGVEYHWKGKELRLGLSNCPRLQGALRTSLGNEWALARKTCSAPSNTHRCQVVELKKDSPYKRLAIMHNIKFETALCRPYEHFKDLRIILKF